MNMLFSEKVRAEEKKCILEEDFDIRMTKEVESEVETMCNVSEGIYENGLAEETMNTFLIPEEKRNVYRALLDEKEH